MKRIGDELEGLREGEGGFKEGRSVLEKGMVSELAEGKCIDEIIVGKEMEGLGKEQG